MPDSTPRPMIPLISPIVAGPLGIGHLPRMWLKILLHSYGLLAEGYRHGHGGLDEKLLKAFGIDAEAFIAYIEGERPGYQALEAWVEEHATNLSPQTVAAWNEALRVECVPDEIAVKRRAQFGIADPTFANAVPLINLDDWAGIHAELAARAAPV